MSTIADLSDVSSLFYLMEPVSGKDGLGGCFCSSGNVVGERGGRLDLKPSHIANAKPKDAAEGHHKPEVHAVEVGEPRNCGHLAKHHHEGDEEEDCVDVVVEGEEPDVAVHNNKDLLGVDGEEGDKKAG